MSQQSGLLQTPGLLLQPQEARIITTAAEQPKAPYKLIYSVSGAPQHDRQPHPETAKRIPAILAALDNAGVTSQQHADKVTASGMKDTLSCLSWNAYECLSSLVVLECLSA